MTKTEHELLDVENRGWKPLPQRDDEYVGSRSGGREIEHVDRLSFFLVSTERNRWVTQY